MSRSSIEGLLSFMSEHCPSNGLYQVDLHYNCNVFFQYCKNQDRRLLIDLYYQEDQFRKSGNAYTQDSFAEKALESRIKLLSKAKESFEKGAFQFGLQVCFVVIYS